MCIYLKNCFFTQKKEEENRHKPNTTGDFSLLQNKEGIKKQVYLNKARKILGYWTFCESIRRKKAFFLAKSVLDSVASR